MGSAPARPMVPMLAAAMAMVTPCKRRTFSRLCHGSDLTAVNASRADS
jgi:hypothetical protein